MTKQLDLWKSEFGDEYATRNPATEEEIERRYHLFNSLFRIMYMNCNKIPNSILEVGAGCGQNLAGISQLYTKVYEKPVTLYATEINKYSREKLIENVPQTVVIGAADLHKYVDIPELTMTYGVLIHTHPAHRLSLMREIYNSSKRWIICCEYFRDKTTPIRYHDKEDALWGDDYGSLWLDNFKLRVISYGFAWKKVTGLDNVTWWIFEKVN